MKEIIEELGLEGAKPADTPMTVSKSGKVDSDSHALGTRDATRYRRLVAKLNYLAMDRPDIRYPTIMGSHAPSSEDADMVKLKSGAISDRETDLWNAPEMGEGGSDQTTSWQTPTAIGGMLVHNWRTLEILVHKARVQQEQVWAQQRR